jgi:polyhydroxyalkanoate synthesis regulator phasin
MNNSRPIVNISLLLGTIIAVSAFFLVFNNIPVQALHKEQQLLESFDDLADFAKAVKSGDEEIEDIPIQSMKAADIYDDADDNLKDCIDQAAEIGDSLTDREVVHCVDDVNYFNNKYSNSTVSTNATSTATTGLADTGADTTSTSNAADTTSTSNAADTTSTSNAADTTSTSDDSNENNLVDELVKTGKFTEAEAREFVSNNMQSGTGTDTTSDIKTSNADTNTADTETSNADTNTADTETSNADTNTDSSASDDTSSSNNEDNNNQSSNNNSNNPEDYDDLNELVNDIKNGDVDTDKISLSAFQDSGAYQGADQETQDCIDLAGKIGNNLGDQEIVNCSEDPNFYRNEISNNNDNNADDSSNNADDSSNNADDSSNNADDSSNNADDSSSNNNN